jgi:hypothetical protein
MMMRQTYIRRFLLSLGLGMVISACSSTSSTSPEETSELHMPSLKTLAPPPTYSRTRWVRPPEVLPQRDLPGREIFKLEGAPSLRPIFSLSLHKTPLEETARILAATARYSSYTAPSIASQKISVQSIGTIDELGEKVAEIAGIHVVVDHEHKEVRFLAVEAAQPRFYHE